MKGWLIRSLVTVIGITLRYRIVDPAGLLTRPAATPSIFVFWHNRIFLMPHLFRKYWVPRGHERVAVLVSRSRDGQMLADVLAAFRLRCVRGSSSRGGSEALLELTRLVKEGFDIGITPDGPRGPRYVLQLGCINLAQLTGAAIIPVSYELTRKVTFKSWDAFMVPLPFGRCTVHIGQPLTVPREADAAGQEAARAAVEQTLNATSSPP